MKNHHIIAPLICRKWNRICLCLILPAMLLLATCNSKQQQSSGEPTLTATLEPMRYLYERVLIFNKS